MLQRYRMTLAWTLLVPLLTLTHVADGGQRCLPNCLPSDRKTKADCLLFQKVSACRSSRHYANVPEDECACLWMSYIRATGPFQDILTQGKGFMCLKWSLKNCGKEINTERKKNEEELKRLPITYKDAPRKEVGVNSDEELRRLLDSINRNIQNLDDGKEPTSNENSSPNPAKDQKTGEVYGVLDKKAGTLRVAERIEHKGENEDTVDMIGPSFGKEKWWLWNIKDNKFKLLVFTMIILFVIIYVLLSIRCITENASDTKKEKLASKAGDLDPDMYHFSRRRSSFLRTSDGLSEEKKRSHIQTFVDKLRSHQRNKQKNSDGSETEMFHANMRRKYLEDIPRLPSPVRVFEKKMVRLDAHAPAYRSTYRRPSNVTNDYSDEDMGIYDRAESTLNNTYEQPFPLSQRDRTRTDPIYYNEPSEKYGYSPLSPVSEEKHSADESPGERRRITVELPPDIEGAQRVGTSPDESERKEVEENRVRDAAAVENR